MIVVWKIAVAALHINVFVCPAFATNGMASLYFTLQNSVCSTGTPFLSRKTESAIQCLTRCMRYAECKSADWVIQDVHLGVCNLFRKRSAISDLLDDCACQHYERAHHHNCHSWYKAGMRETGVYEVTLDSIGHVPVYCVMDATSGGWTVFHRRFDGSLNFNQNWTMYREGFGDVYGEHWLGFNKIIEIMKYRSNHKLRVDLERFTGEIGSAVYSTFNIEGDLYKLTVSGYKGNIGDSLRFTNHMNFSTLDMDNDMTEDVHCATRYSSGWWFNSCFMANLNGKYHLGTVESYFTMSWKAFTGYKYISLRKAQMMFL